jgi:hypothetical protein
VSRLAERRIGFSKLPAREEESMLENAYGLLVREDVLGERSSGVAWMEYRYGQTFGLSGAHSGGDATGIGSA